MIGSIVGLRVGLHTAAKDMGKRHTKAISLNDTVETVESTHVNDILKL